MKSVIYAVLLAFVLAGCNTLPTEATEQGSITRTVTKKDGSTETTANKSDYAAYLDKATESKPLFEMTCPETGCVIKTLKVNAPSDGSKLSAPVVAESAGVAITKGFFGLATAVIDRAAGAVPFIAGAAVLNKAFDKANSSVTTITTNTDASNRSVDNSNRSVTTTTDNGNRSVNNSNNRSCQTGAPTGTTGQTGSSGPATC
jgi:hypothetical protein